MNRTFKRQELIDLYLEYQKSDMSGYDMAKKYCVHYDLMAQWLNMGWRYNRQDKKLEREAKRFEQTKSWKTITV